MNIAELHETARALVAPGKGILAADESFPTIEKRFTGIGIESTEANRCAYREMLFTAPEIEQHIAGVILFDETLRQSGSDGSRLAEGLAARGIVPGIKVDRGAKPLALHPGEKVTEGLDGLADRLAEYRDLGARFAKWRAVIAIDRGLPSGACLRANAHALARYAALCQEAGIVPIVEPEVLMDGDHGLDTCDRVTRDALHQLYAALFDAGVALEGTLLKPNMVIAGTRSATPAGVDEVAAATVACLRATVPGAVPGIVFLSGGQSSELATAHLSAMNALGPHPWELSFSYGRALQDHALKAWAGRAENVAAAQTAFAHRARCNGAARDGSYTPEMERAA